MSQDSPLSRLIGGRYQLEHRIARGGMAEVWLASDTFLHRQVAVKLLKPHLANDANVAERFRREASLSLTAQARPDLLDAARAQGRLSKADTTWLATHSTRKL